MRLWSRQQRAALTGTAVAVLTVLLGGLLATPAQAAIPTATVTSSTPASWDNRSAVSITVYGSGFVHGDIVVLRPVDVQPWTPAEYAQHEVVDLTGTSSDNVPTTSLSATIDLATRPAGRYQVLVKHPAPDNSLDNPLSEPTPNAVLTVYDYGNASVWGVSPGVAAPTRPDCQTFGCGSRGGQALDLRGANIAAGADVQFLDPATGKPDPELSFFPGNDTLSPPTGFPSSTLLQGNYDYTGDTGDRPAFIPGRHLIKVVNSYPTTGTPKTGGSTAEFWQPWFAPLAVSTSVPDGHADALVGAGGQHVVLSVRGRGIRQGTALGVTGGSYDFPQNCDDIQVGPATVTPLPQPQPDGSDTLIQAVLDSAPCTTPGYRGVYLAGPDGASFFRHSVLTVTPGPTVDSASFGTRGQGANHFPGLPAHPFSVTGTGFAASGDPSRCPVFDFGSGTTSTTLACPSATRATVVVDVSPTAAATTRDVRVTNPGDGGSSTTAVDTTPGSASAPLTVTNGPVITSITPSPFVTPGTSTKITFVGTGFHASMTLDLLDPADESNQTAYPGAAVSGYTVTPHSSSSSTTDDTATFTLTLDPGARPGRPTVVLTNQDDFGTLLCTTCLGVNSLLVSPGTAANSGPTALTLTGIVLPGPTHLGGIGSNSTVTLRHVPALTGQEPIAGTGLVASGADQATATVDLTDAGPGKYDVAVVLDHTNPQSPAWSCGGCLTVTAPALAGVTLAPKAGAQGLSDWPVRIGGTGLSKGMSLTIDAITVHDLAFHPATGGTPAYLSALVDVPPAAATGGHDVTLTPADGKAPATLAGGFAVNPPPHPASLDKTVLAQGAGTADSGAPQTLTVTGTDLDADGATLDLGPGITVTGAKVTKGSEGTCILNAGCSGATPDTLTAGVAIAADAIPGARPLTLTNADGGTATMANAFTVTAGPKVLSLGQEQRLPLLKPDGQKHTITVTGSGFATDAGHLAALAITPGDGLTVDNVTVVSATQLTADVTVAVDAARGARVVSVTNPSDHGYGGCATCAFVAVTPGALSRLTVVPGPNALTATWAAGPNGGAPVTGYVMRVTRVGSTAQPTTIDVAAPALSRTISGLVNGATYTIAVRQVTAAGIGPATTRSAVAGVPDILTLASSARLVPYGGRVTLSGRLTGAGTPLAGRRVVLAFVPASGPRYAKAVTTSWTGTWSTGVVSAWSFTVRATWVGDVTYRPASSSSVTVAVAARVLVTSPTTGSSSSASRALTIAGSVSPNKAGTVVSLHRYVGTSHLLVARATLSGTSRFAFTLRPARGTYTYRVVVPAARGNAAGMSAALRMTRT